jgi:hypothetical protein
MAERRAMHYVHRHCPPAVPDEVQRPVRGCERAVSKGRIKDARMAIDRAGQGRAGRVVSRHSISFPTHDPPPSTNTNRHPPPPHTHIHIRLPHTHTPIHTRPSVLSPFPAGSGDPERLHQRRLQLRHQVAHGCALLPRQRGMASCFLSGASLKARVDRTDNRQGLRTTNACARQAH